MRVTALLKSAAGVLSLVALTTILSAQTLDWTALPAANFPHVGGNLANLRHSGLTKTYVSSTTHSLAMPGLSRI